MAVNQRQIQIRSIDPEAEVTSFGVNSKLKAVLCFSKGVVKGFDFNILAERYLQIYEGLLVKDYVTIEYLDKVTIDTDSLLDGIYYVVAEYEYYVPDYTPPTQPPYVVEDINTLRLRINICEIKIITRTEYINNESKYLFLGSIKKENGALTEWAFRALDDPSIVRIWLFGHNSLNGLQGGDPYGAEKFHLSLAEKTALAGIVIPTVVNHNDTVNIKGGSTTERWHFAKDYYHALTFVLLGDQNAWHNSIVYQNGGRIDADVLGTVDSSQISPAVHTHNHVLHLTNKQGTGEFHVSGQQLTEFRNIINNSKAPNALHINGKSTSDVAFLNHTHEHNNLLNIQVNGDINITGAWHLSEYEHTTILGIANKTIPFPNTAALQGHPASDFALVGHSHDHNQLTGIQGGNVPNQEVFHFTEDEYTFINGLPTGASKVGNTNLLDGNDSSYFAFSTHSHNHNNLQGLQGSGTYHLNENCYNGLEASTNPSATNPIATRDDLSQVAISNHNDLLNIQGGSSTYKNHLSYQQWDYLTNQKTTTLHTHNSRYYTKSNLNSEFVNTSGDSFSNELNMAGKRILRVKQPYGVTDIASKSYVDNKGLNGMTHNDLLGLQGGNSNGRYHLTNSQLTMLTSGDTITLHNHNNHYYNKQSMDDTFVNITGDTMNASINLGGNKITNVSFDSNNGSLVTKSIVDNSVSQLAVFPGLILAYDNDLNNLSSGWEVVEASNPFINSLNEFKSISFIPNNNSNVSSSFEIVRFVKGDNALLLSLVKINNNAGNLYSLNVLYDVTNDVTLYKKEEAIQNLPGNFYPASNIVYANGKYYQFCYGHPFTGAHVPSKKYIIKMTTDFNTWTTVFSGNAVGNISSHSFNQYKGTLNIIGDKLYLSFYGQTNSSQHWTIASIPFTINSDGTLTNFLPVNGDYIVFNNTLSSITRPTIKQVNLNGMDGVIAHNHVLIKKYNENQKSYLETDVINNLTNVDFDYTIITSNFDNNSAAIIYSLEDGGSNNIKITLGTAFSGEDETQGPLLTKTYNYTVPNLTSAFYENKGQWDSCFYNNETYFVFAEGTVNDLSMFYKIYKATHSTEHPRSMKLTTSLDVKSYFYIKKQ